MAPASGAGGGPHPIPPFVLPPRVCPMGVRTKRAPTQRPKTSRRGGFQPPPKPSPLRGEGGTAYAVTDEGASFRPLRIYEAGGSGTRPYAGTGATHGGRRAHDVRPYAGNGRRLHPVGSDAPIGTQKAPCPIGDRALMVEKGRSPLLAEVVQAQGGGLSAALPLADGGDHQHDSGDQEGEGLEEVGGDAVEPAQSVLECAG